jgi:Transposase IS66 family
MSLLPSNGLGVTPHQGQVTVPRLVAMLDALGIEVSKRQVVRLLIGRQGQFLDEARDVLRAGLETAAWIRVDDTGARHKAVNGYTEASSAPRPVVPFRRAIRRQSRQ